MELTKGDKIVYLGNDGVERVVIYIGIVGMVKYLKKEPECLQEQYLYNGSIVHIPITAWRFLKDQKEIKVIGKN